MSQSPKSKVQGPKSQVQGPKSRVPWLPWILVLSCGCSKPAPPPAPAPVPASAGVHPQAKDLLSYKTPPEWTAEEPSNPMRKAQYRIPPRGGAGEAASLSFFNMGAQTLETMTEYWRGHMGGAEASTAKIEGAANPVTLVDISGAYSGDGQSIPKARFLGAIVEAGGRTWYLKLVGPAETVDGWRDAFIEMLKGVKAVE